MPAAKPVRFFNAPGNRPRFVTSPYEKPPLIPNPPCALARCGASARLEAARTARVHFIGPVSSGRVPPCATATPGPAAGCRGTFFGRCSLEPEAQRLLLLVFRLVVLDPRLARDAGGGREPPQEAERSSPLLHFVGRHLDGIDMLARQPADRFALLGSEDDADLLVLLLIGHGILRVENEIAATYDSTATVSRNCHSD